MTVGQHRYTGIVSAYGRAPGDLTPERAAENRALLTTADLGSGGSPPSDLGHCGNPSARRSTISLATGHWNTVSLRRPHGRRLLPPTRRPPTTRRFLRASAPGTARCGTEGYATPSKRLGTTLDVLTTGGAQQSSGAPLSCGPL